VLAVCSFALFCVAVAANAAGEGGVTSRNAVGCGSRSLVDVRAVSVAGAADTVQVGPVVTGLFGGRAADRCAAVVAGHSHGTISGAGSIDSGRGGVGVLIVTNLYLIGIVTLLALSQCI